MALTWGVVWGAVGTIPRWVFGVETDAPIPLVLGVFGVMAGLVFSVVLALAERRRHFAQMSLARTALWGALGGVLLAVLFGRAASLGTGELLALASALAVGSAACASGSLALARGHTARTIPDARKILRYLQKY